MISIIIMIWQVRFEPVTLRLLVWHSTTCLLVHHLFTYWKTTNLNCQWHHIGRVESSEVNIRLMTGDFMCKEETTPSVNWRWHWRLPLLSSNLCDSSLLVNAVEESPMLGRDEQIAMSVAQLHDAVWLLTDDVWTVVFLHQ